MADETDKPKSSKWGKGKTDPATHWNVLCQPKAYPSMRPYLIEHRTRRPQNQVVGNRLGIVE